MRPTWLISALARRGSSQARKAEDTMMQTRMRLPQMGWACTFQQKTRNLRAHSLQHIEENNFKYKKFPKQIFGEQVSVQ